MSVAAEAVEIPVERTVLDAKATGYATFQSHNQKVVSNQHGIFTAHIRTRNDAYTAQTWRISRSTDGGRTFVTIHEDTHATNPPVLENDAAGNVYAMRVDFQNGKGYLYRFLAENDFKNPSITEVPHAAAGKYAMAIDEPRGQLYFFSHNNSLHVIGLDGVLRSSKVLLKQGKNAVLQYPQLRIAKNGALHAAWTTQKNSVYLYHDIHHMVSSDAGVTWNNLNGEVLKQPVIADDTGAAMLISLEEEFDVHTWLSSFAIKGGKLHFAYMAQSTPGREHYMRYDIESAQRDIHLSPQFGEKDYQVRGLDGFFATASESADTPLHYVGAYNGHIVCLVSRDNGATWRGHARLEEVFNPYGIGGFRDITEDGYLVGTFTDSGGTGANAKSKVHFIKIRAAE
jgi:hypothetical protein